MERRLDAPTFIHSPKTPLGLVGRECIPFRGEEAEVQREEGLLRSDTSKMQNQDLNPGPGQVAFWGASHKEGKTFPWSSQVHHLRGLIGHGLKRVLGNETMGADGKCSPRRWGNPSPGQRSELRRKTVERVNQGKEVVISTLRQEAGRAEDQGAVLLGGIGNSPGSRSGLSPDRGCRETPGVSCPGPPRFRSREGAP